MSTFSNKPFLLVTVAFLLQRFAPFTPQDSLTNETYTPNHLVSCIAPFSPIPPPALGSASPKPSLSLHTDFIRSQNVKSLQHLINQFAKSRDGRSAAQAYTALLQMGAEIGERECTTLLHVFLDSHSSLGPYAVHAAAYYDSRYGGGSSEKVTALKVRAHALGGDVDSCLGCLEACKGPKRLRTYLPALLLLTKKGGRVKDVLKMYDDMVEDESVVMTASEHIQVASYALSEGEEGRVDRIMER